MTEEESLLVTRYLNKRGRIPNTSQKLITMRSCADEILQRMRESSYKSIREYVWITDTCLTVIDTKGIKYYLKLQKGSMFSRRVVICNEEPFFLADRIKWTKKQ